MKQIFAVGILAILSGCVSAPTSETLREYDLRTDEFFRGDQKYHQSFAQTQRNLFKNKELCGGDFDWRLDTQQISYGTVIYKPYVDAPLNQSVLLDLTSYSNGNIVVKAYSYYSNTPLKARDVLNLLADPTICPLGQPES